MSRYNRFIAFTTLLFAAHINALDVSVDPLYWYATETIDWALNNNLSTPSQIITYYTVDFDFDPGFRVTVGTDRTWQNNLSYTRFYTTTNSSATGNLTSTFLGGKIAQGSTFFNSGQVHFKINYNMFDWDLSQRIYASDAIVFRPSLGLRGGWINQHVVTNFQGSVTITESVKNDFWGIGPKAALETKWLLHKSNTYNYGIIGVFTVAYLWGTWDITDELNEPSGYRIVTNVGNRNLGAFAAQCLLGVEIAYQRFSLKFGYELVDWFDQYQILDDGTGARNVDLLLQGLTLSLQYKF